MRPSRLVRRHLAFWAVAALSAGAPALAQSPTPAPDYSQESAVYEQLRSSIRFENDGTGRRELYVRVRTQSDAGVQAFGQLVLGYNAASEAAEIPFVRVRKPDGTVVATPPETVQDLSSPVERVAPIYTDFRQKHVTVQGLRSGDVLEFSFVTTVHTSVAPGQFWTEHEFEEDAVVLDQQLEIDVPAGRSLILKLRPGFEAAARETDGRRIYRWSRSQLKGAAVRQAEADERKKNDAAPAVETPEVAAVRLTTFQSWDEVGRWYAALEAPQRTPTPEIRKKAAELIAGRDTDLDKLEALYEFVATDFRYVSLSLGMGRYQPRPAGAVLKEQYGDCKDKHTLLASLIEAAGFKAWAVLINPGPKLDPSFPSPSQFNHVITLARVGDRDIWVDTTSEVAPFRLLLPTLRKKQGLVVDGAGSRLEWTPPDPPMRGQDLAEIDARLDNSGKLEAHVRVTTRGDIELLLRTIFRAAPPASWKQVLQEFVKTLGTAGEIANWKVSDPTAIAEPFTLEFDLSISRFVEWTSTRAAVALPLTAKMGAKSIGSDDATTPVNMGAPSDVSYKLRLTLPAEVTARPPLPVKLSRDYASYRAEYAVAGNVLTAERIMTSSVSELPADRRQDVNAFLKVITDDVAQMLALETTAPPSAPTTTGLSTEQLHRSAYAALQAGNHAEAATLYKRIVELKSDDRSAWNNLGRAQLALRQTDDAIASFQRQIAINAYDQYAYNNLGRAYVIAGDSDKAEAAFLKQLEVNPLDKYTPGNLGALYLERRRYDLAAEQFEKGIALNPENSWLHYQAGKAHLGLKQTDKAAAAFDRAVGLSPTPTTWNNIAYELAVNGLQLDRAQQYAESAVASATAASRNLDIARADAQTLAIVRSLGMYWDTLGWVHFARGDVAKAMPYVEMAWRLGQHAEVGDHLGQIHEKQGRRAEAIDAYALALAAPRPSSEIRERLAALLGAGAKVDDVVERHRARLSSLRTFEVPGKPPTAGTAGFLVLFKAPGAVEDVRFVSGADALRSYGDAIRTMTFGPMFPNDEPAKILRRAQLACGPKSCTLTLVDPDEAEPVK